MYIALQNNAVRLSASMKDKKIVELPRTASPGLLFINIPGKERKSEEREGIIFFAAVFVSFVSF